MTSLYGVIRGKPPKFFDGHASAFTGLRFHIGSETFAFYQPLKMEGDPQWIDVTELMKLGNNGVGEFGNRLSQQPDSAPRLGEYFGRLARLLGIADIDLHVEEVTGTDKSLDVVSTSSTRLTAAAPNSPRVTWLLQRFALIGPSRAVR